MGFAAEMKRMAMLPRNPLIRMRKTYILNLWNASEFIPFLPQAKFSSVCVRFSSGLTFSHPSWNANRPVEYWCYNSDHAACKFIQLKDIVEEIHSLKTVEAQLISESGTARSCPSSVSPPKINKWLVFPGRDEATAAVLSNAFQMHTLDLHGVSAHSRAKAEFIVGAERCSDHLQVSVQDLRLMENADDGVDGHVDDVTWIQVLICYSRGCSSEPPPAAIKFGGAALILECDTFQPTAFMARERAS